MRRIHKHRFSLTVLAALMLFGFGSGYGKKAEPAATEGKWVDVNGDTMLEFQGDRMTLRFGDWTETYRVKTRQEGSLTVIENSGSDPDFGLMSSLTLWPEGHMTAREMILDARGHAYRFVREWQKAAELEVQDLSDPKAPKTVESDEIEHFSLSFFNAGGSYGIGDEWPAGRFRWEIDQAGDGAYGMRFDVGGGSYIAMQYLDTVDREYVLGLARLLRELDVPALNGYYQRNNADRDGYELYVSYASGERLSVCAEGDAAETCVLPLRELLEYAAKRPLRGGY